MFCPQCGHQSADDSTFCPSCGRNLTVAPVQPVVDFQAQKNAVRQSEISVLSNAINYFGARKGLFQEYDSICALVNRYAEGAKSVLLVWGCIITTFTVMLLAIFGSEGYSIDDLSSLIMLGLVPGVLMIVGGIMMKVANKKKLAGYIDQYARLSREVYSYYVQYPNCPVGPEYTNPDILYFFLRYLQSGRADTIKDSINLALNDVDRDDISEYVEEVARNTVTINASTRVPVIFIASRFF